MYLQQFVTRTQRHVILNLSNIYSFFFFQSMRKEQFSHVNFYLIFVSHVQHIIYDMHNIVHWSQESRRPDSIWAEWVPNTFPFRNLTLDFTFYFGQNVTRTKSHVIIWQFVTRTQNYVIFKYVILYTINERILFSYVLFIFSYFFV